MTIPGQALIKIQLVVFDLDGTLVDSKLDLALSVNAMRERMGLGPLPLDLIASYIGHGVTVLVERALGDLASPENVQNGLAFFLQHYHQHMLDNTRPYPGVREALEELRGRALAVLTNKPVRFSREMLERLAMASHFASIYGGNSFARKKPDPVGLRKIMDELKVPPRQTLMVGDSDTDVVTGRNADVWTCGVTYGFGADTLEEVHPDMLLDNLRKLPRLLNRQGRI
jgi:phosphoglycolate phosphatase